MKPRFLRPSYFVWTVVPVLLYGAYALYGLPHFIWSYDFRGTYSDRANRWYVRCTFVGLYGTFTTFPTDGKCPWLHFAKSEAGQ